jgi:integrase
LAEFAYLTGWRLGEIVTLRWSQVDLRVGVVRLEPGSTKNDEGRVFPFAVLRPLEALLRDQRARTDAVERAEGVICPSVFHAIVSEADLTQGVKRLNPLHEKSSRPSSRVVSLRARRGHGHGSA